MQFLIKKKTQQKKNPTNKQTNKPQTKKQPTLPQSIKIFLWLSGVCTASL